MIVGWAKPRSGVPTIDLEDTWARRTRIWCVDQRYGNAPLPTLRLSDNMMFII